MGKSPIPKPTNWDKMTPQEQLDYIEKMFLKPMRKNAVMHAILMAAVVIFIMIFGIYLAYK